MPTPDLPCVATFIAPVGGADLAKRLPDGVSKLPHADPAIWLDEGRAVDVPFQAPASDLAAIRSDLAVWQNAGAPLDIVLQPSAHRRKKLFLADMDSTMIGQECIDELADFAGLKPLVSSITERAMRGELAFEPALRERVALLEGLPVGIVDEVIGNRITLTPGGVTLVRTMRAHGTYCALVSGGFTLFTGPIGARIGFHEHRGNTLIIAGERFSGEVAEPILGRAAKLATLIELRERLGLTHEETLAVGDGANDLAMIEKAGLGVAYRAKPAVAAAAGARIDVNDLSALLFAQGYTRSSFMSDAA